jgi:hypothetical protein
MGLNSFSPHDYDFEEEINHINTDTVELCLTYRCNNRCNNCSTLCSQAPATNDLSMERIQKFILESVDCNHKWKTITLHGGEPTLHPRFQDVCEILMRYKRDSNPECNIWVVSNGYGDRVTEGLEIAKAAGVGLGISYKQKANINAEGVWMQYVPMNNSALDNGQNPTDGCAMASDCGVCLNNLGYFQCSAKAAMARVFYIDPVDTNLQTFLHKIIAGNVQWNCGHCGFAWEQPRSINQITSPTWAKALERYRNNA